MAVAKPVFKRELGEQKFERASSRNGSCKNQRSPDKTRIATEWFKTDVSKPMARPDGTFEVIILEQDTARGAMVDLDLEPYQRNPVVLWQHQRFILPVARTLQLEHRDDGSLVAIFEFDGCGKTARRIRGAWERGFLRMAEIGVAKKANGQYYLAEWSIVSVPHARGYEDLSRPEPEHSKLNTETNGDSSESSQPSSTNKLLTRSL